MMASKAWLYWLHYTVTRACASRHGFSASLLLSWKIWCGYFIWQVTINKRHQPRISLRRMDVINMWQISTDFIFSPVVNICTVSFKRDKKASKRATCNINKGSHGETSAPYLVLCFKSSAWAICFMFSRLTALTRIPAKLTLQFKV